METDPRIRICGQRYQQRRASGKAGWTDETPYSQTRQRLDVILTGARIQTPCRFLELGCGNGNLTLYMADKGHEAHGIDIVPEAIEWARDQASQQRLKAQFEVGNVVSLSCYADDHFDFVFDAGCLIMILGQDRKACVASVRRVLKPGGIFYAETHLLSDAITQRMIFNGQDYFDPKGQYSTVQGHPMYYYSREQEFMELIEGAGFQVLQRQKEPPYPTHQHMTFCAGGMWVVASKPKRCHSC